MWGRGEVHQYTRCAMHDSCGTGTRVGHCSKQSNLAPLSLPAVTPVAAAASGQGEGESWVGSAEKMREEGRQGTYKVGQYTRTHARTHACTHAHSAHDTQQHAKGRLVELARPSLTNVGGMKWK